MLSAHSRVSGNPENHMRFFVYILAGRRNGTLYIGMTDNLARRVWQDQEGCIPGFTKKYGVKTLVWYEVRESRENAFVRECQLKKMESRVEARAN
jgi:putative endonuclease